MVTSGREEGGEYVPAKRHHITVAGGRRPGGILGAHVDRTLENCRRRGGRIDPGQEADGISSTKQPVPRENQDRVDVNRTGIAGGKPRVIGKSIRMNRIKHTRTKQSIPPAALG